MSTLTRKQLRELERVRDSLQWAVSYLNNPTIVGIATEKNALHTNGGDYRRINDDPAATEAIGTPLCVDVRNHKVGSPMAGIYTALWQLDVFLTTNTKGEYYYENKDRI